MAADGLTITEPWIREKLNLQHSCLADVRSLTLPGTYEGKICRLGTSLKNFVRLKSLDLSHNALVTVQGLEHLELLERLSLYYNRLGSLQDVFALHKLQNLKELDLRLNPVVRKNPHYRLYLVHAMSRLRQLDECPVRDRERRAALMLFSSEDSLDTNHQKHASTPDTDCRSSELRIKATQKMMKMLSLLEGNEEAALNEVSRRTWSSRRPEAPSVRFEGLQENPCESDVMCLINDPEFDSPPKQHKESVPKSSDCKKEAPAGSHATVRGQSVFTPHPTEIQPHSHEDDGTAFKRRNQLQDRANPVLHPPRLTYRITSERKRAPPKGAYRKPMELLLGVMEELWSGEKKENRQNRTLLVKTVQILGMMERDVAGGELEIRTLKETLEAFRTRTELQEERHRTETEDLKLQLRQTREATRALSEQMKDVLEENVSLQKRLIKAEKRLLKKPPDAQDRGQQTVPEESDARRREGNGADEPQESYRSLIARNERLLQQLEEALV
ncbi:centrosomal protein of 72 kDa [Puntigrus tetrazona]|uniref:centrosomal protein of 72 kDa n=1 Tax=Puntigrus tetrazona TaxID=1606681 RepID=UPI001C8A0582|nr:centrosomal protein of 72 kDa [Puntigrus tetrazona]